MINFKHKSIALGLCCFLAQSASAGTVVCEGAVEDLGIHQPGLVALRLSSMNMPFYVCNINADYRPAGADNISPATCKAIYASLLAAKHNNVIVRLAHFDGDQAPASCSTVQPGSQVYLRYFLH